MIANLRQKLRGRTAASVSIVNPGRTIDGSWFMFAILREFNLKINQKIKQFFFENP